MRLSRRTDPHPSVVAGENAKAFVPTHESRIEAVLWEHFGKTSAEIARDCGLRLDQVYRRMDGMEESGLCHRGGERLCTVLGKSVTEWFHGPEPEPVNDEIQQLLFELE